MDTAVSFWYLCACFTLVFHSAVSVSRNWTTKTKNTTIVVSRVFSYIISVFMNLLLVKPV